VLHWDGSAGSQVDTGIGSAGYLENIWGASAHEIFSVGGVGTILRGP